MMNRASRQIKFSCVHQAYPRASRWGQSSGTQAFPLSGSQPYMHVGSGALALRPIGASLLGQRTESLCSLLAWCHIQYVHPTPTLPPQLAWIDAKLLWIPLKL